VNATVATRRTEQARAAKAAEEAALRRVAAHLRAEAAELEPGSWLHARLVADHWIGDWGEHVLPELDGLVSPAWEADHWVGRTSARCPLEEAEESALRRLAAHQRAEAVELGDASPLARRLERWGIRIALDCARPEAPPRLG
jgi:hypothetical protein